VPVRWTWTWTWTRTHLQALGLLPDLHRVLLPQLLLAPLVVLHLVGELRLVLGPDQVGPGPLDRAQLAELQLLGRLVVPQQHGALQVLLGLLLVQVLEEEEEE